MYGCTYGALPQNGRYVLHPLNSNTLYAWLVHVNCPRYYSITAKQIWVCLHYLKGFMRHSKGKGWKEWDAKGMGRTFQKDRRPAKEWGVSWNFRGEWPPYRLWRPANEKKTGWGRHRSWSTHKTIYVQPPNMPVCLDILKSHSNIRLCASVYTVLIPFSLLLKWFSTTLSDWDSEAVGVSDFLLFYSRSLTQRGKNNQASRGRFT